MAHLNSQFGESVKLMAVNPDSIIFNFDRNEVKKVPVKFNADVTFKPGFDLSENYKLIPDSIKIMGPTILLDSISVVETQVLNAQDIKTDIDMLVNLILPDSSENLVYSHKKITVKGKVDKFTEGTIEVPVDIKNVPSDIKINYFPKVISVSYYTSLANFKEVTNKDFIIECDYSDLIEGRTYLEPVIKKYPEKVKNVKLNNKRIEFIISE
jgi:YbbR domain-containing protein